MFTAIAAGNWHDSRTPWSSGNGPNGSGPTLGGLGLLSLLTTSVALLLMWALLTEPVQLTSAVSNGGSMAVARLLWNTVSELVVQLIAWI
jgi:hypothetical protein